MVRPPPRDVFQGHGPIFPFVTLRSTSPSILNFVADLPRRESDMLPGASPEQDGGAFLFETPRATPSTPNRSFPSRPGSSFRRKIVYNWAGSMGQSVLLAVDNGNDPIIAPHSLAVRYDLRTVSTSLIKCDAYLAAFDMEKLRRKGSGIGLDALQASASWIARDCLCAKMTKIKSHREASAVGVARVLINKVSPSSPGDSEVMLRVIAVRSKSDTQDWRAIGTPLALQVATGGKMVQQAQLDRSFAWSVSATMERQEVPAPDDPRPEYWGIRVQQVIDFYEEIRENVLNYCNAHKICTGEGPRRGHHVCLYEPCPFRVVDRDQWDDHRGHPFVKLRSLSSSDDGFPTTVELVPSTSFIVDRYIRPITRESERSLAHTMNHANPLKCTAFVTHAARTEPFQEFLETLKVAADSEEVVFISAFSLPPSARDESSDDLHSPSVGDPITLQALSRVRKLIVAVDKNANILSRLRCHLEIAKARKLRMPTLFWPHSSCDLERLETLIPNLKIETLSADSADEPAIRGALWSALRMLPYGSLDIFDDNAGKTPSSDDQDFTKYKEYLVGQFANFPKALGEVLTRDSVVLEHLRQAHSEHERILAIQLSTELYENQIKRLDAIVKDLQDKLEASEDVVRFENMQKISELQKHVVTLEEDNARQGGRINELETILAEKDEIIHRTAQELCEETSRLSLFEQKVHQMEATSEQMKEIEYDEEQEKWLNEATNLKKEILSVRTECDLQTQELKDVIEKQERYIDELKEEVSTLQFQTLDFEMGPDDESVDAQAASSNFLPNQLESVTHAATEWMENSHELRRPQGKAGLDVPPHSLKRCSNRAVTDASGLKILAVTKLVQGHQAISKIAEKACLPSISLNKNGPIKALRFFSVGGHGMDDQENRERSRRSRSPLAALFQVKETPDTPNEL